MASVGVPFDLFFGMLVIFVGVMIFLGWYGYRHTKDNQQFLLGRNKANTMLIALSYGATFLSASAIIGFGGQAATHGMSLLWLCFLNLFLGLFVAFVLFGPRVRRIGRKLGASTFADLLGKIFKSKGIRGFTAAIIIVFMPIYCAAVLKGGVNSLVVLTGTTDLYDIILIVLAIVVGLYVVYGGIIAVMYNDALQAGIMVVGMAAILAVTLYTLGGFSAASEALSNMWTDGASAAGTLPGFNGWTSTASFGTPEWLTVVSTFLLGVGIGALTQPQLVVRFMSAKDDRMLNRSLIVGSIFMLIIVGSAYTVGSLTNVYFFNEYGQTAFTYVTSTLGQGVDFIIPNYVLDVFSGYSFGDVFICVFILSLLCAAISTISALMHTIGAAGGHDIYSIVKSRKKKNTESKREEATPSNKNLFLTALGLLLVAVASLGLAFLNIGGDGAEFASLETGVFFAILTISMLLVAYFAYKEENEFKLSISVLIGMAVILTVILFIVSFMALLADTAGPVSSGMAATLLTVALINGIFALCVAAAIILKSPNGTAKWSMLKSKNADAEDKTQSLRVNRMVTAVVMVLVVVYCYLMPNDIIAKATSLFMGMTAAALLPLMTYGLFAKKPRKKLALASVSVGTASYLFWALFINAGSSIFLPICKWITGNPVLFMEGSLKYVDALIIALPLSAITLVAGMIWIRKRSPKTSDADTETDDSATDS
ncbi:MAG: sodium:solute symporter family protein [Methanomassiliicoccaceae archaeon]|nr:sodium:solute symporter family protein [Methanomassiliicoccaceae archaeon]